jgi:hypothetical protein
VTPDLRALAVDGAVLFGRHGSRAGGPAALVPARPTPGRPPRSRALDAAAGGDGMLDRGVPAGRPRRPRSDYPGTRHRDDHRVGPAAAPTPSSRAGGACRGRP